MQLFLDLLLRFSTTAEVFHDKLKIRLKSCKFDSYLLLLENYRDKTNCFEFLISNYVNFLFSYLCVKSKLEELRGYKAVPVMSSLTFYLCLVCIECELDCTYHVVKSNSELLTNAALIIESEVF